MLCLKDKSLMLTTALGNVTVDVCPICQSIWFDTNELYKINEYFTNDYFLNKSKDLGRWLSLPGEGSTLPKDFWHEAHLFCPKEGSQMRKHYFAGTKIGIDNCEVCQGFFIEGEEFKSIWEEVSPNPLYDNLAKHMWSEMKDGERLLAEIANIPLTLNAMVTSPIYGLIVIARFIIMTWFDLEKYQSKKE
jgi:Zn-finger nucleic acid-binding protein